MSTTLTPSATFVTTQHPKGLKFMEVVGAAYNRNMLSEAEAQHVNEAGGLKEIIDRYIAENRNTSQYKGKKIQVAYGYPSEYRPKPIDQQIMDMARIFELDPTFALEQAKNLPPLESFVPEDGRESYFAVLYEQRDFAAKHFPGATDPAEKYCRALQLVHRKIAESRSFTNWRDGQIDTAHIRVSLRTQEMMQKVAEQQKGDILIIAAQTGKRWGGHCVGLARDSFVGNEFGLTSVSVGSIILVHPKRLVRWEELDPDCAGDEFSADGDGQFGRAPFFDFFGGARFGTSDVSIPSGRYGSASGFVPQ